uniref:Uncharacterized protein n=1 Tax=Arundo donax TaxID=35708 RepID=A0A0A8Y382_ARUDO
MGSFTKLENLLEEGSDPSKSRVNSHLYIQEKTTSLYTKIDPSLQ